MAKLVYDFTEGNKDLKDLLGGKGANLAEMTNLGLPVPPGFTITTEACRQYLREGAVPAGLADEVSEHLRQLEKKMGRQLGDPADPLLVSRPVGGQVLHAGHDGDRPEHRPDRRVGARPGQAVGQRAVRLGLLPPADPDVRQDRARHRGRGVRARARRRPSRPRAPSNDLDLDAERPARARGRPSRSIVARARGPRLPAGPARADGPGGARGVRLVERRPGDPVPPPGADPGRPRHRGQRRGDGLRQPRHGLRHRRRVHPRPGHRRSRASTATTCRTPRARTSSPASATPSRCRTWSSIDQASLRPADAASWQTLENHYRDLCDIEFTIERGKLWMLQTRVGKRTAGGRVPDRHPARRRGPDRPGRGAHAGSPAPSSPS